MNPFARDAARRNKRAHMGLGRSTPSVGKAADAPKPSDELARLREELAELKRGLRELCDRPRDMPGALIAMADADWRGEILALLREQEGKGG